MLNVMRENLKSLKWLLWVVALSMVAYLGSFFFDYGPGAGGVARGRPASARTRSRPRTFY